MPSTRHSTTITDPNRPGRPRLERSQPPAPDGRGDGRGAARLLAAAEVPGPYVLVGHSLGGLLVRLADIFRALMEASPKHIETLIAEQQAVQAIHDELAAARITSLGDLSLVVLSHGQPMAMPGLTDAVNQAYGQLWQELQAELAGLSSRGRLVVADDSGHYIQLERPELVLDAIAEVMAAARTSSGAPAT